MSVSKAAGLIVVVLLLVTISFAHLEEEEWGKLVSALFTGVDILDNHGRLLVEGTIAGILATNHKNFGKYVRQKYPTNQYFPNLAASFGETFEGGTNIKSVFFSSQRTHAEEKVIESIPPGHHLHSITTNYSPCGRCVERILHRFANLPIDSRPVIQFPWVYNYPRTSTNLVGICQLAQCGFKIKLWETIKVLQYLIEQAPNPMLRQELKEAIFRTAVALIERDRSTQKLITTCKKIVELSSSESDSEEESEDDEEPCCHGWGKSRRDIYNDDDDDKPGAGGATIVEEEEVEPTAAVAGSAVPPRVTPTEEPHHRDRELQHSTAQGGPSTGSI